MADSLDINNKPKNIILICGILLAFIIPVGLSMWMGKVNIAYYDKLLYSRFFYWGTALYLYFYASKFERQPLLIVKENKITIGFFVGSVLVLYLLYIAAAIVSAFPILFGIRDDLSVIKMIARILKGHYWLTVFVALTAGVTEEFIFRGYMLTRLLQLTKNPVVAIVVSSLLFSAMHYKYNSLHELIFAFLIGIIFSIYYLKYSNIKAIIVVHFLIDLISMTVAQHLKLK
ncbi:CPBP family intramembrane glutamic endopeptidase [Mucilaginibacter sp. McL0603]|uniref:CPBP family intramembrane glutamic endopeptidase n=1 Tax=Mucilaginibacter sp. McL0603 TaxID=3415670 RepID=UPI003CE983F8